MVPHGARAILERDCGAFLVAHLDRRVPAIGWVDDELREGEARQQAAYGSDAVPPKGSLASRFSRLYASTMQTGSCPRLSARASESKPRKNTIERAGREACMVGDTTQDALLAGQKTARSGRQRV